MNIADSVIVELETLTYNEVMSAIDEKTALACTAALFNCLYLNFKSKLMYVPSTHKKDLQILHQAIYSESKGRNHKELAIKYKVSEQTIYKVIKTERKHYIDRVQNDLFKDCQEQSNKPITLLVIEDFLPSDFQRCGLTEQQSTSLANKISDYLCENFPGISIVISQAMKKKRDNQPSDSIFTI